LLNGIWLGLMLAAVLFAAFTGRMDAVKMAALTGARDAVDLVIGLRAKEQSERIGLDLTDHRETGYTMLD